MSIESIVEEQLASMDMDGLDELSDLASGSGSIFGDISPGEIIRSLLSGDPIINIQTVYQAAADQFLHEISTSVMLGIQLVLICIIIGLLKNMADSFSEDTVASLGAIVCSCCMIVLCLKSFMEIYQLCCNAVETMTVTMQTLLPILVPLLIAMGGFTSGGVLNPLIVTAITIFNSVLQKFIMPAVYISCVFLLINSLSEKDYVKKLALLIRGIAVTGLGLMVTLFSGLTLMQGLVTRSADGMLGKTIKYSADNFVPIVGSFASGSVDLILSCTCIIKNGIGIFGVLIILTLLCIPMLKILAVALVFKVTAVIIEPIGSKNISDCLSDVGNTVITLAVILFLAAMMFIVFLAVIIGIGGGSLWK